jgi:hypothetical protein
MCFICANYLCNINVENKIKEQLPTCRSKSGHVCEAKKTKGLFSSKVLNFCSILLKMLSSSVDLFLERFVIPSKNSSVINFEATGFSFIPIESRKDLFTCIKRDKNFKYCKISPQKNLFYFSCSMEAGLIYWYMQFML